MDINLGVMLRRPAGAGEVYWRVEFDAKAFQGLAKTSGKALLGCRGTGQFRAWEEVKHGGLPMLRLSDLAEVGRKVRQDDWDDLGQASQEAAGDAIDDGREEEAKALAQYTIPEGKALHDLFLRLVMGSIYPNRRTTWRKRTAPDAAQNRGRVDDEAHLAWLS